MFESLLARIATALDGAGIPYMVIGGQAVLLYGEPRLTRDIDVTLGVDSTALDRLVAVIRQCGLKPAVPDLVQFVKTTNVVPAIDEPTGIRVDFIFSFTEYERIALGRVNAVKLAGAEVHFASIEDLIIHKLVAARARDLDDIRSVLGRYPEIDEEYLSRWLGLLSTSLDRNLVEEFKALEI